MSLHPTEMPLGKPGGPATGNPDHAPASTTDTERVGDLALMRNLFARLEALEKENEELKSLLGLEQKPVNQPNVSQPTSPETSGASTPGPAAKTRRATPLEAPRTRDQILETRARHRQEARNRLKSVARAPENQAAASQLNALKQMLQHEDPDHVLPAEETENVNYSKKTGKVRSKMRLRFRFFSMSRVHALIAGLCIAAGSISGAFGQVLNFPPLHYAGLAFAGIGITYMIVVGIVALTFHLSNRDDEDVIVVQKNLHNRPSRSIFSTIIYLVGRLFHFASRP